MMAHPHLAGGGISEPPPAPGKWRLESGGGGGRVGGLSVMNQEPGAEGAKHDCLPCPACGETFRCMANRAEHCPCSEIPLTRDEMQELTWTWGESCLCPSCLVLERDKLRA